MKLIKGTLVVLMVLFFHRPALADVTSEVISGTEKLVEELKETKKITLLSIIKVIPGLGEIKAPSFIEKNFNDIILESPLLTIDGKTFDLKWENPLILGKKINGLDIRLHVGPGLDGTAGASFGVGFPEEYTLNDFFPGIKKVLESVEDKLFPEKMQEVMKKLKLSSADIANVIDMFKFTNVRLVASLSKYTDPIWGPLKLGLNTGFKLRFAGPFEPLEKAIFGKNLGEFEFKGLLSKPPKFVGSEASVTIPGGVRLVKFGDFEMQTSDLEAIFSIKALGLMGGKWGKLLGKELDFQPIDGETLKPTLPFPAFKLIGGLRVKFPFQDGFCDFKVFGDFVAAVPPNITFGGQMDGMIKNIFGIPGAHIGNLGLAATFEPVFPYIRGGAFRGETQFGKSKLAVTLKGQFLSSVPGGFNDIIVDMRGNGATKDDLVDYVFEVLKEIGDQFKVSVDLDVLKNGLKAVVPPFEFGEMEIVIVPKKAEAFGQEFGRGIHMKASANIMGLGGGFEASVKLLFGIIPTFESKMWMDEILIPKKNPFLIITGGGADLERGKGKDGPVFQMNLSLKSQKAFADGLIQIPALGIHEEIRFLISPLAGIEFKLKHKLGGIFDSELEFQGKRSIDSWWIKGYMKQDALNEIIKFLTDTSDKIYKQVQEDAAKEKHNLDKAKAGLDIEKQKLVEWEMKAKRDVEEWVKKKIAETQWHIDNLKKKIKSAQDKCKNAEVSKKLVKCADTLAIPAWGTALATLELHKKVTLPKLIQKVAKDGIKFASSAAKAGINAAKVAIGLAKESVKAAVFAVGAANKAGKVIAKILKVVSQGVIQIKEVSVAGSLEELVKKARMAEVRVIASVLGKPFDQKYQIDFKNPDQFPKQILNGLKQLFS